MNYPWVLLLLAIAVTGCSARAQSNPTRDLPTVIALTVEADLSSTPTATDSLAVSTATSLPDLAFSPAPSATIPAVPTGTPVPPGNSIAPETLKPSPTATLPPATIQILSPGPASKAVSPIHVNAYLAPGARGNITLELLGEDGRLLVRKILSFAPVPKVHVLEDLDFEISAAAEAGRLQISTEDKDGRIVALASVDILLMALGQNDINPPGDLAEDFIIREPAPRALIQGGIVTVAGLARPVGTDPLIVELIAPDGKPAGPTRLLDVQRPAGGGYAPFSIDMPYSVTAQTWALIVIS
ncbi:MAG: hypothetical protein ACM3PY_15220, partial [Omnitrophica WOR_2 bacterium]